MNNKFATVLVLMIFILAGGCGKLVPVEPVSISASVESIDFRGWWWSPEEMSSNFNPDAPPPKTFYVRLERWDASSDNDFPHPNQVDILCLMKNTGNASTDFIVTGIIDFKIASYSKVIEEPGPNILDSTPWTEKSDLETMVMRNLSPGESRRIDFLGLDVGSVIDKYNNPGSDLWPWVLRVRINIETPDHKRLVSVERTLDLIPGD